MTVAVTGFGSPLNTGFLPRGPISTYLESGSIFNSAVPFAGGCGYFSPNFCTNMGVMSDNMTSLAFKQRSNQHVLGSYNEIMQKNLSEMSLALREGETAKAAMLYDEVYEAISKNYGEEITTQEQRVAYDQSIKATIARSYQQINGTPLYNDIHENGEGYFTNGFMQGLTLGNHSSNSAEELESYMLGTGIQGYQGKQVAKTIGKVTGSAVGIGTCAAIGAGIGSFVPVLGTGLGAVVGAGVGALLTIGNVLFGGSKPVKVTEAY